MADTSLAGQAVGELRTAPRHRMTAAHNSPVLPRKLKVLLAEDNLVNRVLAQKLLEKHGHAVVLANNGREAIALWETNPPAHFDAILMDIQMPLMDGLQATAHIRAREESASAAPPDVPIHIPIIAMTAHAMKGDRERYLAAGMDGYVSKPVVPADLEKVLQSVVAQVSRRGFPAAPEPSSNLDGPPPSGVEETQILARFDGDRELVRELAELFILECPKHLNQMRAALRDNNAKNLAHSAHTLKGSAGNFSSKGIYETAQELELLAREGKLDGVPELLKTLEDQLAHFNQILAGMIAQTVR